MLEFIPKNFLSFILIFSVVTLLVATAYGILLTTIRKLSFNQQASIAASLICVVVAGFSWVLNMGWLRFVMTILLIPFGHAIAFLVTVFSTVKYIDKSPKTKILNILFITTYLLFYAFLPDGGDVGGMYLFFGLIRNDVIAQLAYYFSGLAFVANAVIFIMQIAEIKKSKKTSNENGEYIDAEYVVTDEDLK